MATWTFLTNYSHILILIRKNPDQTSKEMALSAGITERAVQKIIHDLEEAGYIKIKKIGRRNHYTIVGRKKLRHEIEKKHTIDSFLSLFD